MSQPLRIFIGYDPHETVAYHVLAHSILRQSGIPVAITPLSRTNLGRIYTRERGATESTEFSITRFLVPYLCGYQGPAVFMDCDMLVQADVAELLLHAVVNPDKAVIVCQHDYTPSETTKFLGQPQTAYPRKNWSSVMVFNTEHCRRLTPEYVNSASGLDLHRFNWLRGGTDVGLGGEWLDLTAVGAGGQPEIDNEMEWIGSLPLTWNHLVGEYAPNPDAKNLHWTLGGPWFSDYALAPHAERWYAERDRLLKAA
jgi:hypothetical protein